ncbi:ATP-binding protein [Bacillus sp. DTU_2020_1000418_1_SI_GHA_SEK_038]|uniref:two-component system sensor histidine kinase NtrB n=1 Tax=Bacillus sp. DTU_2020_1000418_1_SI_GHA_SEK_038 TaxID=3077585 RepID=UPI0028E65EBB|nr:ATP-binding protein [Bacillus sp. DTU_2020_1000418_1_SI_GHA_SEK_038]WNS77385.1 ATP-binding protein [Bacillus sp. DTU_2020_1000418_1_SI_GHA_SEK_038]
MVSVQSNFNNLQENSVLSNIESHDFSMESDNLSNVSKLAAAFAHEIRNPLTTIKGYIQLIKPYLIERGKEHYADIALNEINRANDLIIDLLNFEKSQTSQKREVSLNQLISNIASLFEGEGLINKIKIDVQPSQENPSILGNEKQLKQVLINILKNAIESLYNGAKDRKQITLALKKEASHAYIIIEDNGCGMTAETIEHIFTPFYTTKETGTGIGLPICKKIIEAHNGSFHINSSAGKGTIMTLTLPLYIQKSGA